MSFSRSASRAMRSPFNRDFFAASVTRRSATCCLTQRSTSAAFFSERVSGCGCLDFFMAPGLFACHRGGQQVEIDLPYVVPLAAGTSERMDLTMGAHRRMRFATREVGPAAAPFAFGRIHDHLFSVARDSFPRMAPLS